MKRGLARHSEHYLSSWDTGIDGSCEMDHVYDQVALLNCGDLTMIRPAFPGFMTV
jgi:hypothetical protein